MVDEVNDTGLVLDSFVPPGSGGRWPWSNLLTWCLSLLMLGGLVAATSVWSVEHFASRLDRSVKTELLSSGVDASQLKFDWDYRDVVVSGKLPADSSEEQLLAVLRNADNSGIRKIRMDLDTKEDQPEGVRFGTVDVTAVLKDGQMILQGAVLTTEQRDQLQAAAVKAIGVEEIRNEIVISGFQEQTPGSDQRVASLANSIAGLSKGATADARLSATDFRFNATVSDEEQADDLLRLRGNAGDLGLVISGDIVTRQSTPGGVLDVIAKKDNGRILLSGTVTSEAHRQTLVDAATGAFDQQSVIDEISVAENQRLSVETERAVSILAAAIDYFDDAVEASAWLTEDVFTFNATMELEEETGPLIAVANSAQDLGMQLSGSIDARQISLDREVSLLQAEIDGLRDEIRENVVFESGKADLDFTAKQTLDKVVDAMNRYLRPVVEVGGHTDANGSDDANRKLSLFRATAVLEYLKISGIDGLRLRAIGLGESSPIASNSTEIGRLQNRRVEFIANSDFQNQ